MKQRLVLTAAVAAIVGYSMLDVHHTSRLHAQDTTPAFEVASIKRNKSADGRMTMGMQPGGRLTVVGVPVRNLIVRAYGVQPNQIVGGPDWIASDRFDVIAKAETDASPVEMNLMLRSLLADRFKLAVHNETRELPIFELVLARDDRRLGPELKPAAIDCGPQGRGLRGGPPSGTGGPPSGPPQAGQGPVPQGPAAGPGMGCRVMFTPGRIQSGGQPLSMLTTALANQLGRPVVDKTGLTGNYDLTLAWTPDQVARGGPPTPPPGAPPFPFPPIDPDGPSLFTALQEQLGLKLDSTRGPVDVLVIDRVEQPTED